MRLRSLEKMQARRQRLASRVTAPKLAAETGEQKVKVLSLAREWRKREAEEAWRGSEGCRVRGGMLRESWRRGERALRHSVKRRLLRRSRRLAAARR